MGVTLAPCQVRNLPPHHRKAFMISLADLQRRIDAGDLSPDAAVAQSLEAIGAQDKNHRRLCLPYRSCAGRERRAAARHCGRHQGHHGYGGFPDRNGLADLPGISAARRRSRGDDAETGRRDHRRQDHDHRIRLRRSDADAQSAQSWPHARRIVIGFGGSGGGRHGPARAGDADRRFGNPARIVLRRRRDQAVLPLAADGRRQMLFVDARYRRPVRGRRGRRGARACRDHGPARIAAAIRHSDAAHRRRDAGFCR